MNEIDLEIEEKKIKDLIDKIDLIIDIISNHFFRHYGYTGPLNIDSLESFDIIKSKLYKDSGYFLSPKGLELRKDQMIEDNYIKYVDENRDNFKNVDELVKNCKQGIKTVNNGITCLNLLLSPDRELRYGVDSVYFTKRENLFMSIKDKLLLTLTELADQYCIEEKSRDIYSYIREVESPKESNIDYGSRISAIVFSALFNFGYAEERRPPFKHMWLKGGSDNFCQMIKAFYTFCKKEFDFPMTREKFCTYFVDYSGEKIKSDSVRAADSKNLPPEEAQEIKKYIIANLYNLA